MGDNLGTWWVRLPAALKVLVGTITVAIMIFVAGGGVREMMLLQGGLPARVEALEVWRADSTASRSDLRAIQAWQRDSAGPSLRFLACSQRRANRGLDPRTCEDLMRGLGDFLPGPGN